MRATRVMTDGRRRWYDDDDGDGDGDGAEEGVLLVLASGFSHFVRQLARRRPPRKKNQSALRCAGGGGA